MTTTYLQNISLHSCQNAYIFLIMKNAVRNTMTTTTTTFKRWLDVVRVI